MKCPACHKDLLDGMKLCGFCGNPLPDNIADPGESSAVPDRSLGEEATIRESPREILPPRSLGDIETLAKTGDGSQSRKSGPGTPLSERYELLEEVGRGGFAVVWKARDRKLGRTVAVKRLLPERLEGKLGQQTLKRFEKEASSIARLNHRNIVTVYDHDRDSEGHYIVMEYVDGGTLKEYLKSRGGKLERGEAVELVRGIAQGLGYAHRNNLIHRDIKPANVLLQRDGEDLVPKIVDFGLARVGTENELSMSGFGMGTPWYMPPEQRRNAKGVNHTADIYALGKTLYELVSGEIPDNVDSDKVPDQGLLEVVLRCVKSKPGERYFSVKELLEDLEKGVGKKAAPISVGTVEKGKCPSCGHNNELSSKYCESCGAGLFSKCPKCSEEIRQGLKHCPKCGVGLENREKFNSHIERGDKYAGEGKLSSAIKEYEVAMELEPGDERVAIKLSLVRDNKSLSLITSEFGEFVQVPAGSSMMGSSVGSPAELPVHEVQIKRGFLIGRYPVTQKLYRRVMGVNPSRFKGEDHPVEKVSWYDAIKFCRKATELMKKDGKLTEGWEVRLPTEAEWEYACRAGTKTGYYWGRKFDGDYCWYYGNTRKGGVFSGRSTQPVGQKKPNSWGIHDMIGNVWEWCRSLYWEYPYREDDGRENIQAGGPRVLRGGSWWVSDSRYLISSHRYSDIPGSRSNSRGFRVVLARP